MRLSLGSSSRARFFWVLCTCGEETVDKKEEDEAEKLIIVSGEAADGEDKKSGDETESAFAEEAHNLALGLAGAAEGPTITNDGSNSLAAGDGSMMETDRDMAF